MKVIDKLFYGTWELDGILKDISPKESLQLLKYAKQKGINKFDTALVYGNGNVERILSQVIDDNDIVLTKIPAITKPSLDAVNILDYYPKNYIYGKVAESLNNLNRDYIDIVLLHNWSVNWKDDLSPISELIELKRKGIIRKIGISLPNNYNERLSLDIVRLIDFIEAPYNDENTWILEDLDYYKKSDISIILRSLFMQGKLIKSDDSIVEKKINIVKALEVYTVIGMTSEAQIDENIRLIKK